MSSNEKWLTVNEFAESVGKSVQVVRAQAFRHQKHHGEYPHWYSHDTRGHVTINVEYFMRMNGLKADCHRYASSPHEGIYWYLMNYMNRFELSKKLAVYSRKFKSEGSWNGFLSKGLWRSEKQTFTITTKTEKGQLEEFIVYGCFILYSLAKRLGVREHESE